MARMLEERSWIDVTNTVEVLRALAAEFRVLADMHEGMRATTDEERIEYRIMVRTRRNDAAELESWAAQIEK